jgi:hypothetical protein
MSVPSAISVLFAVPLFRFSAYILYYSSNEIAISRDIRLEFFHVLSCFVCGRFNSGLFVDSVESVPLEVVLHHVVQLPHQ